MKDITPFKPNAQGGQSLNPLHIDITTTNSEIFRGHERQEARNLLLDLTVLNP